MRKPKAAKRSASRHLEPMISLAQVEAMIAEALALYQQSWLPSRPTPNVNAPPSLTRSWLRPTSPSTREELEAVDDLVLNRLAQTLQVPDYSGRANGRMQANAQDDDWVVIETPAGWERQ